MKEIRRERGITLVALILTIVVLLILAVVTINAIRGDGVIKYAQNAKDKYKVAQTNEQKILDEYLAQINKLNSDFEIKIDNNSSETGVAVQSVSLKIKPKGIWKAELTEEEAVAIINQALFNDPNITTLEQLDVVFYNLFNDDRFPENPDVENFEDLKTVMSSYITLGDDPKNEIFSYLIGINIYEVASEVSVAETKVLKVNGEDVTERATWRENEATYEITLNGTYIIQLELDGKISIETIEVNNINYVGSYVKYDADQDGSLDDEILYKVFYGEGELGEGEGAQIISNDVVGKATLGSNDNSIPNGAVTEDIDGDGSLTFEKAMYSYNNMVDTLNQKCAALSAAKQVAGITKRVRSVGSDPLSSEDTRDKFYKTSITWFDKYDGLLKAENHSTSKDAERISLWDDEEYYEGDVIDRYWFATSYINSGYYFCVHSRGGSPKDYTTPTINAICGVYENGTEAYSKTRALRPVLVLESGVLEKAVSSSSGSGTESDPYILKP